MPERFTRFEQREYTDRDLSAIESGTLDPVLNMCFRHFWEFRSRLQAGEALWIYDLNTALELHMGFEDIYGHHTEDVLSAWKEAQDRKRFTQST